MSVKTEARPGKAVKKNAQSSGTVYTQSDLKPHEHILAFAVCVLLAGAVFFIFYHHVLLSLTGGLIMAPFLKRMYSDGRIRNRRKRLRTQFCDMLESMSVAARAGNTELRALEAALADLKLTYPDDTDIVIEVTEIINKYNNGIQLRVLFKDFAERSGIEDIMSFAQIFEVIEGKSNKFADIIRQTQQMITDKVEIEEEIETVLTSAKQESNMMMVMPAMLMLVFSADGKESMLAMLFTTTMGRLIVTGCLVLFCAAFFLARKMTDIKV